MTRGSRSKKWNTTRYFLTSRGVEFRVSESGLEDFHESSWVSGGRPSYSGVRSLVPLVSEVDSVVDDACLVHEVSGPERVDRPGARKKDQGDRREGS